MPNKMVCLIGGCVRWLVGVSGRGSDDSHFFLLHRIRLFLSQNIRHTQNVYEILA